MKLYCKEENYKLYEGNMLDMLDYIEKESIDSIITDPPYELNFMGKGWDRSGIAFNHETWKKCYEVLKPGGYLLAFGGSRTFYRIACAIEDAGFEIRDTIMWLYGSGFPKSMDIGFAIDKKNGVESLDTGIISPNARPNCDKSNTLYESGTVGKNFTIKQAKNEWAGWGTCLKPAYEPIIVARKPFKGSLVDNVIQYGVGGINIDECRVGSEIIKGGTMPKMSGGDLGVCNYKTIGAERIERQDSLGRFPANVILTYDESDKEEVCGGMPDSKSVKSNRGGARNDGTTIYNKIPQNISMNYECGYDDEGSASRYFYCAKASKKDRDEGLDEFKSKPMYIADNEHGNLGAFYIKKAGGKMGDKQLRENIHPTVKPIELMQYLIRLVSPKGSTILDCFMGSGSTGKAAMYENNERNSDYKFIGIELTEEYLPICKARIEFAKNKKYCETNIVKNNEDKIVEIQEQLKLF